MARISAENPSPQDWQAFLGRSLTYLAAGSLLAAAVCFIAYNWNRMGVALRFGLAEGLILGLALGAWRAGLEKLTGQILLFSAVFLVGPLLAIYGQAYPSGKPLSSLLFMWTFIAAAAALLSGLSSVSLLAVALLNAALASWQSLDQEFFGFFGGAKARHSSAGLIDLGALALSLWWGPRLASKAGQRLLGLAGAVFLNIGFIWEVFDNSRNFVGFATVSFLAGAAFLGLLAQRQRDLFHLCVALLCLLSLANSLALRFFEDGAFFLLTWGNMAAGTLLVIWLIRVNKAWEAKP